MKKNDEYTKKIFDLIARLKRTQVHSDNNSNNDLRRSEELFLINIDLLSTNNAIKITDLISSLKFAPSTISTFLKSLEDSGHIIRETNKENRREVLVNITKKGQEKIEVAKARHINIVKELTTYLGNNDADKLIDILEKTVLFFEKRKENERGSKNA